MPPLLLLAVLGCTSDDAKKTGDDTAIPIPLTAEVSDLAWTLDDDIRALGKVTWTQAAAVDATWVEFRVGDEDWRSSPAASGEPGAHEAWVAGVPYGATVEFRVGNEAGGQTAVSDSAEGTTDALPPELELPTLDVPLPEVLEPGVEWILVSLTTPKNGGWKVILDREGRIVWAQLGAGGSMRVSVDGTQILSDEIEGGVYRMRLDGTIVESIELPGLHHSFMEVSENALLYTGKEDGRDGVWERTADGTLTKLFDCATFWEEHAAGSPCDGNTLNWRESDDTVLFSSDNDNTVVHLTRSGEVLAYWGQLEGSGTFASSDERWWKNHSPIWTDDGTLMVSSWLSPDDHTLVAREYAVSDTAPNLTQIYLCDMNAGILAEFSGETRRFDNGNTLLNYGPGATIREYTPDCEKAWEVAWPEGWRLHRLTTLSDLYPLLP